MSGLGGGPAQYTHTHRQREAPGKSSCAKGATLVASETSPPEEQVSASETAPPEAVRRRLKRSSDLGTSAYPPFHRPAAFVTFCSSSSISKIHPTDPARSIDSPLAG